MAAAPRVNKAPRLSANELANYMMATDQGRLGILKRAKFPSTSTVIRYKDVRSVINKFLSDRTRNLDRLLNAEQMFEQRMEDPAVSALMQDDASNSIEVLKSIARMSNKLSAYDFHPSPKSQSHLVISNVRVSVYADLIVEGLIKGVKHRGAAILRMTQDNSETEAAKSKRREMGLFAATILRMHVDQNLSGDDLVSNKFCMSIDIQCGEAFSAPPQNATRQKNIEAVCQMIASYWPSITR